MNKLRYKFRGYDIIGQKGWVYGDFTHGTKITREKDLPRVMVAGYEVSEDSVGQFTGLKDKNGKEIYEGDIVEWSKDHKLYVVIFRFGMFYASVEELNKGVYGGFPLWFLCEEEQPCEIKGNIYEKNL